MATDRDRRAMSAAAVVRALESLGDPDRAAHAARYFRTAAGEYGEGDVFVGVTVPEQRKVARAFADLPMSEIDLLFRHPVHECRLTALIILVRRFGRAAEAERAAIVDFYLAHTRWINNWDLVDTSARDILGAYLISRERSVLDRLAGSSGLWERRIAIIATYAFIRHGEVADTLRIAEILLHDAHHLIHKAVGWMLHEADARAPTEVEAFLHRQASSMPRVMLRYAVEKMPRERRALHLSM